MALSVSIGFDRCLCLVKIRQ